MSKPLDGIKVLVLRPEHQAGSLATRLRESGATPLVAPAIRILPPRDWTGTDAALDRVADFDWIVFTSVNGVTTFMGRAADRAIPTRRFPRLVGAIGPGTAAALRQLGLEPSWQPASFTSAAISAELPDPPNRALLVRADIATDELDRKLRHRGFDVTRVDAYRTAGADPDPIRSAYRECDAVALTSASIVRSFAGAVAEIDHEAIMCSIGPATSAACRECGIRVDIEAGEYTIDGLLAALGEYYRPEEE